MFELVDWSSIYYVVQEVVPIMNNPVAKYMLANISDTAWLVKFVTMAPSW